MKKAKEAKEKVKGERVKVDKKEVRKEKLVSTEQPEEKLVKLLLTYTFVINFTYTIELHNYFLNSFVQENGRHRGDPGTRNDGNYRRTTNRGK